MAEETKGLAKPAAVAKPQVALNVAHYEGVFSECMNAARRVADANGLSEDAMMRIAESLFSQFCGDQLEVGREKMRAKSNGELIQPLMSMLERRGL
jgi:hypothetical protein